MMINYLEKFKLTDKEITLEVANDLCTNISFYKFSEYTNLCITKKDLGGAIKIMNELYDSGYSVMDILDNYFLFIKTTNIDETIKFKIVALICKYISIFYNIHEDYIEFLSSQII